MSKKMEKKLLEAVRNGKNDIVKDLIKKGVNVNAINELKVTALMYAVVTCSFEIVKLLVDKGADVNSEDKFGYTPLIYAIIYRNNQSALHAGGNSWDPGIMEDSIKVAKLLIKSGARVNAKTEGGWDVLYFAERELNNAKFEKDFDRRKLHLTLFTEEEYKKMDKKYNRIYREQEEILKIIKKEIYVKKEKIKKSEIKNKKLFDAIENRDLEKVKKIIFSFPGTGTYPQRLTILESVNVEGKTPLEIAEENDYKEIVELIKTEILRMKYCE